MTVWRARDTADHRRMFTLRGHGDYVRCVAWHPAHPWLAVGYYSEDRGGYVTVFTDDGEVVDGVDIPAHPTAQVTDQLDFK